MTALFALRASLRSGLQNEAQLQVERTGYQRRAIISNRAGPPFTKTLDGMRILHHVTILLLGFAPLPVWASGDPRQVVVGVAVVMLVHAAAIASAILWPLRQRTWQLKVAASFVGFLASVAWSLAWLFGDWKLAIFDEPYNDSLVSTIWLVVPFVFLLIAGVVRFRRVNPSS